MPIRAADVMTTVFHFVAPTLSVLELSDKLLLSGVSGFPVAVDGERPIGVVSRTDILRGMGTQFAYAAGVGDFYRDYSAAEPEENRLTPSEEGAIAGARLAKVTVDEIMTREIISVAPDDPIANVARTLVGRAVNRVLVVEENRLRGILSSTDLVRAIADERIVSRP